MSDGQNEEQLLEHLQDKMIQESDLRGLIVNDDNMIVKFHTAINNKKHNIDVEVCRDTAQIEIIKDENDIRKDMMSSINISSTISNYFEIESIINNTVKSLLKKIKV